MTTSWAWTFLVVSGLIDVVWAYSMKKADGFQNEGWAAISIVLLALFVYLLTRALQVLPLGVAYSVWTGIGAAGSVLVGMVFFSEPVMVLRLFFVALILAGIIGLNLS